MRAETLWKKRRDVAAESPDPRNVLRVLKMGAGKSRGKLVDLGVEKAGWIGDHDVRRYDYMTPLDLDAARLGVVRVEHDCDERGRPFKTGRVRFVNFTTRAAPGASNEESDDDERKAKARPAKVG